MISITVKKCKNCFFYEEYYLKCADYCFKPANCGHCRKKSYHHGNGLTKGNDSCPKWRAGRHP